MNPCNRGEGNHVFPNSSDTEYVQVNQQVYSLLCSLCSNKLALTEMKYIWDRNNVPVCIHRVYLVFTLLNSESAALFLNNKTHSFLSPLVPQQIPSQSGKAQSSPFGIGTSHTYPADPSSYSPLSSPATSSPSGNAYSSLANRSAGFGKF